MSESSIFGEARDQFLTSLSPKEQSLFTECTSSHDLLASVKQFTAFEKNKRHITKYIAQIQRLSDNLTPYFDVIGILVSSNPEYAAIAWGAFRLVLQLASNYIGFFEKLLAIIERFGESFPQYDRISHIYEDRPSEIPGLPAKGPLSKQLLAAIQLRRTTKQKNDNIQKKEELQKAEELQKQKQLQMKKELRSSKPLKNSLIKVYVDLFMFFQSVARVFTKADGSIKRSPVVIGELFWKPFDVRFQGLLERMKFHKELIEMPQRLNGRKLRWKGTSTHKSAALQKRPDCNLSRYAVDMKRFSANTLWIYGNPGSGKTILAASTIAEIRPSGPLYYFFFKQDATAMNKRISAYRALFAQLIDASREDHELIDQITFAMTRQSGGQTIFSQNELVDLLEICLERTQNALVILDGIDECVDHDDLVRDLLRIQNSGLNTKFLLLGRPNIALLARSVPVAQRLSLTKSTTSKDITILLTRSLERFIDDDLLVVTADIPHLVSHLVKAADGMILWARLMINFLASEAHTPATRLRMIMNISLPEGLDAMYDRILNFLLKADTAQQELAKRIFLWLMYCPRDLTSKELHDVLVATKLEAIDLETHRYPDISHTVVIVCAGLVEVLPSASFQFVHLSVKEYFRSRSGENAQRKLGTNGLQVHKIFTHPFEAQLEMSSNCLSYITFCIPAQPLSGKIDTRVFREDLTNAFPFASYAASYWIQHLHATALGADRKSIQTLLAFAPEFQKLLHVLKTFLSKGLVVMAWIETYYTTNILKETLPFNLLLKWSSWLAQIDTLKGTTYFSHLELDVDLSDIATDIRDLSRDLESLHKLCGPKLATDPVRIWDEVTAFCPSRFFTKTSSTTVGALVPPELDRFHPAEESLCKISETSPDGLCIGVLTVWPSLNFKRIWSTLNGFSFSAELKDACTGWIGRYEMWSIETEPRLLADLSFPLQRTEIWMRIRQAMRRNGMNKWQVQFPMTISRDLQTFVILRTVFHVQAASTGIMPTYTSFTLPVDFTENFQRNWTDDRKGFVPVLDMFGQPVPAHLRLIDLEFYAYSIWLSKNGNYLFFEDEQFGHLDTIAVFAVNHLKEVTATLVDSQYFQASATTVQRCAVFHPLYDLVVFSYGSFVELWEFRKGKAGLMMLHSSISPLRDSVRLISFSECGNHIIISQAGEGVPVVFPLFEHVLSKSNAPTEDAQTPSLNNEKLEISQLSAITTFDSSASIAAKLRSRPGQMVDHAVVEVTDEGQSMGLVPHNTGSDIEIRLWQPGEGESHKAVSLPAWEGLKNSSVAIKFPQNKNEMIRLILTQPLRRWYSVGDPVEEHLPAVIDRDPRAIRPATDTQAWILNARRASPSTALGIPASRWAEANTHHLFASL
ncbi:hypothetical protein MMC11_001601 [Xylographa trunciseda]|nr:hypothetical protein [Xylographa trunciseda]